MGEAEHSRQAEGTGCEKRVDVSRGRGSSACGRFPAHNSTAESDAAAVECGGGKRAEGMERWWDVGDGRGERREERVEPRGQGIGVLDSSELRLST